MQRSAKTISHPSREVEGREMVSLINSNLITTNRFYYTHYTHTITMGLVRCTMYIICDNVHVTSSIRFTTVIYFSHLLLKVRGCWTPVFLISQRQPDLTVQDQFSYVVKQLCASLMMGREDSDPLSLICEPLSPPTVG